MRLKRIIAFTFISLVLLTLCFSCIRSRVMPQPDINFEPTRQWDVKIYYIEPEKPYIKIGMVEAEGAALSSWKNVENSLRKKAAKIGGDAVIVLEQDRPVGGITSGGIVYKKKYLRGTVIKWKKDVHSLYQLGLRIPFDIKRR